MVVVVVYEYCYLLLQTPLNCNEVSKDKRPTCDYKLSWSQSSRTVQKDVTETKTPSLIIPILFKVLKVAWKITQKKERILTFYWMHKIIFINYQCKITPSKIRTPQTKLTQPTNLFIIWVPTHIDVFKYKNVNRMWWFSLVMKLVSIHYLTMKNKEQKTILLQFILVLVSK